MQTDPDKKGQSEKNETSREKPRRGGPAKNEGSVVERRRVAVQWSLLSRDGENRRATCGKCEERAEEEQEVDKDNNALLMHTLSEET